MGEQVVVNRVHRRGELHVTLPGGRVNERESIVDALRREVLEEVGLAVDVGQLLLAAEVVSGARIQDVELVFEARPRTPIGENAVSLVDPRDPACDVPPPVLGEVMRAHSSANGAGARWLGNLYTAGKG